MSMPKDSEVFVRMIDALEEAASCARQLAFLRQQQGWFAVDERILQVRKIIITFAEANQDHAGRIIRPN